MSWKALTHRKPRVIVVIPAFNEERRVGRVIRRIPKDTVDEILVVDDHSADYTARESVLAGASVISHDGPRGAGAAIKAGYLEGLRRGGNILVVLAGDMQHDPSEIPRLLEVVEEGSADYVVGDRLSGDPVAHGMPPLRYVGNVVLTFLTRLITRVDVKDSQCGYTAITSEALERIDMESLSESWGITNGLLAECRRSQIRVKSVPVSTCYGTRTSYIRFPTYVPCMLMVLLRAFFRIARKGTARRAHVDLGERLGRFFRSILSVERLALLALFALGFVSRLFPLLQFQRVGYDPLLHYQFAVALLEGKTNIAVANQLGGEIMLYYPPLFHLLCLPFFLAFPTVDPYLIMKFIVSALGSLLVFPIYYIVKDLSRSAAGAMIAAFLAMITPSDFHMISWGGYANIAGFLLIAILVYLVMKGRPITVGIVSTVLFLTHHLSMLFAVAILVPYFLLVWWQTRRLPRCLISFIAAIAVAYVAFYWYALIPLFELYTEYAPRYAEFTLRSSWPQQFGFLLLVLATAGVALSVYKTKLQFSQQYQLLLMWLLWPLLLGYAYVFGVQWHSIRWIYFLQQPACVWSGLAVAQFRQRRLLLAVILVLVVFQWVSTMLGYYSDVAYNAAQA